MQRSLLPDRMKLWPIPSVSKQCVAMTRPPSFGRRSSSRKELKEFKQVWLSTLLEEQGLVQQQTEQADLLTWRAEQQQQELITQLSAAASSVNEPIQLTKLQQETLGMDVLHGPVLDLSLLESSLMRQELSVLYPDHAASASNTKHASKISSKPSSMAAAGSRSPSTAKTSSRKSSRSSSKESRLLQDRSLSADAELSALTVSIQETNNLMRETNFLYGGAIARIEGLLASSSELDNRAEAALNKLLAIASDDKDSAAATDADRFQQHLQQYSMQECQQEQLFAVYGSQQQTVQQGSQQQTVQQGSQQQSAQLFKTPEQQCQLDDAVQQGLLVVPLSAAVGQLGAGGAVSAEQLAWMMQEGQLPQQQSEQPAGNMMADDMVTEEPNNTNNSTELIKVEVKVTITTKPGQDVVLVGSHPSLGSWSMDDALPLTWTDGHVWRATIELPADCSSFEYKAVLRCPEGYCWEAGDNRRARLEGCDCITLQHTFRCS